MLIAALFSRFVKETRQRSIDGQSYGVVAVSPYHIRANGREGTAPRLLSGTTSAHEEVSHVRVVHHDPETRRKTRLLSLASLLLITVNPNLNPTACEKSRGDDVMKSS